MNLNIFNFLKSMQLFKKNEAQLDLEASIEYLQTLDKILLDLKEVFPGPSFKSEENKKLTKEFYKEISKYKTKGLKLSSTNNFTVDLIYIRGNLLKNSQYLNNLIADVFKDTAVRNNLDTLKANLARAVAHMHFISKYMLELVNYIYINEAINGKIEFSKDFQYTKKQKEFIESNAWIFARLCCVYAIEPDMFQHAILKLDPTILLDKDSEKQISASDVEKIDISSIIPSGFVGSPIYSLRLVFAQWEADKYRKLQDEKKLLQLRYLHYKNLQERGESDINVEKQIELLQKRITDIDYVLNKIEESVED
jgi:hypothetical protein